MILYLIVYDLRSPCVNLFSLVAGMKYDLKRVEEVHYDVKIRGLTANGNSSQRRDKTQETEGQP